MVMLILISYEIIIINSEIFYFHAEPIISARITTRLSEASSMAQKGYSLICSVDGGEDLNPSISYQWTKNNGTQIKMQTGNDPQVLSVSLFRLSDAGEYTCLATISSSYVHDIIVMESQHIAIQSELIIHLYKILCEHR